MPFCRSHNVGVSKYRLLSILPRTISLPLEGKVPAKPADEVFLTDFAMFDLDKCLKTRHRRYTSSVVVPLAELLDSFPSRGSLRCANVLTWAGYLYAAGATGLPVLRGARGAEPS